MAGNRRGPADGVRIGDEPRRSGRRHGELEQFEQLDDDGLVDQFELVHLDLVHLLDLVQLDLVHFEFIELELVQLLDLVERLQRLRLRSRHVRQLHLRSVIPSRRAS